MGFVGFDVTVSHEPVIFDLYIDGRRQAERVVFAENTTGAMSNPAAVPFGLSSASK